MLGTEAPEDMSRLRLLGDSLEWHSSKGMPPGHTSHTAYWLPSQLLCWEPYPHLGGCFRRTQTKARKRQTLCLQVTKWHRQGLRTTH